MPFIPPWIGVVSVDAAFRVDRAGFHICLQAGKRNSVTAKAFNDGQRSTQAGCRVLHLLTLVVMGERPAIQEIPEAG